MSFDIESRKIKLYAAWGLIAAALTGCGGGGTSTDVTTAPSPAPAAAPTPAPVAAAPSPVAATPTPAASASTSTIDEAGVLTISGDASIFGNFGKTLFFASTAESKADLRGPACIGNGDCIYLVSLLLREKKGAGDPSMAIDLAMGGYTDADVTLLSKRVDTLNLRFFVSYYKDGALVSDVYAAGCEAQTELQDVCNKGNYDIGALFGIAVDSKPRQIIFANTKFRSLTTGRESFVNGTVTY